MTCRELVDFLGAYLDGELSEADEVRRRFEQHLAACPECAAYLATYRETVKLTKSAFRDPDDPVPAGVPEDLVKAIRSRTRSGRPPSIMKFSEMTSNQSVRAVPSRIPG